MPTNAIPWTQLLLLRLCLGLCGVVAGLLLGGLFLVIWHWVAVIVLLLFRVHAHGWIYLWDLLFIGLLAWDGYHYKARMPPPSPFTNQEAFLTMQVTGVGAFTPQQAAFSISEVLYLAPRFLFWGLAHWRRATWPSGEMAESAGTIYAALRDAGSWVPSEQLQGLAASREMAARAMAMLVKAELATARVRNGALSLHVSEPEWV